MNESARVRAYRERVAAIAAELAQRGARPEVAVVAGSGLGDVSGELDGAMFVPFRELEGMPSSGVPGHAGRFVLGRWNGVPVIVQEGRLHLYEGHAVSEVTLAVRVFAGLGADTLLLTNAAGGIHADWPPGALMRVVDHLDFQASQPCLDGSFPGSTEAPYDAELGNELDAAAGSAGVTLRRGIYAGMLGPAYETPTEIRMVATMGADAVGMSTVAEARAAREAGLRVGAISCITNPAAGVSDEPLRHEDVVATAGRTASDLRALVAAWLGARPT